MDPRITCCKHPKGNLPTGQLLRIQNRKVILVELVEAIAQGWKYRKTACLVILLSLSESELTKTESTYLAEMHRQSPKEKASKAPTVRRRKRPHAHLRVPHLEEVMSPVTTPTDEDVGHRIKHVAGVF